MSSDKSFSSPSVIHQYSKSLFGYPLGAPESQKFFRTASMSIVGSMLELPWAMALLNIKNNMIVRNMGAASAAQHILNSAGIAGFYRGIYAEMLRQLVRQLVRGPSIVMLPSFYKQYLPAPYHDNLLPLASGVTIAVADATVTAPLESLKTYLTTKEAGATEKRTFKPFAGYRSTLMRQSIAWPLLFFSSNALQTNIKSAQGGEDLSYTQLAAISPLVSAAFIWPTQMVDNIKTRQQSATSNGMTIQSPTKALWQVMKTEGPMTLMRGALVSALQRTPAAFMIIAMPKFYRDLAKEQMNSPITEVKAPSVTPPASLKKDLPR